MSRKLRAMRNDVIVRQLPLPETSSGGIYLGRRGVETSLVEVVSVGSDCTSPDIVPGNKILMQGFKSGVPLGDDLYSVREDLCWALVEDEEK